MDVPTSLPAAVRERLLALAPDQRAAALAPPGPVLCVAPAGSGKTTTLVARIAWRVADGGDPRTIAAIAFNRRAAVELAERLDAALEPLGVEPGAVRVRTFHALGLEVLRNAGRSVDLADRTAILRRCFPDHAAPELAALDTALSRLKLEHGVRAADVELDPDPGPLGEAFLAYQRALAEVGTLDFDDLVIEALRALEADGSLLERWRSACSELHVDEVQDVDRTQLALARLLAGDGMRLFLVGDDDQSIYGWRLADVRRLLGLAAAMPGLRRVDLEVNYRCPAPVVERAGRLIEHNRERLAKRVRARPGASGHVMLVPSGDDDVRRLGDVVRRLPAADGTQAILTRTNRELLPAVAVALEVDRPFRSDLQLPIESPVVDAILAIAIAEPPSLPDLVRLDRAGRRVVAELATGPPPRTPVDRPPVGPSPADDAPWGPDDVRRALLGWAAAGMGLDVLVAEIARRRSDVARLRRDDASLVLATAHSTKGLEFDDVVIIMDRGRLPSPRAVREAAEPVRALEEERRLAYVAWTRARRSLTLVYDPAAPSMFLAEAFTAEELGVEDEDLPRGPPQGPCWAASTAGPVAGRRRDVIGTSRDRHAVAIPWSSGLAIVVATPGHTAGTAQGPPSRPDEEDHDAKDRHRHHHRPAGRRGRGRDGLGRGPARRRVLRR